MKQRRHHPLAVWDGIRHVATGIIIGKDVDHGGGPVGTIVRRTPGGQLARPDTRKARKH